MTGTVASIDGRDAFRVSVESGGVGLRCLTCHGLTVIEPGATSTPVLAHTPECVIGRALAEAGKPFHFRVGTGTVGLLFRVDHVTAGRVH
jgi:hypothetical protein